MSHSTFLFPLCFVSSADTSESLQEANGRDQANSNQSSFPSFVCLCDLYSVCVCINQTFMKYI